MAEIGTRIRELREARNLTLQQVAAHIDISAEDLTEVENGQRQLSHQEIQSLCAALDVPVDELFKAEQQPPGDGESLLIPADKLSELLDQMKGD